MKFKVGEKIVHITHGVGIIKSIETREFNGVRQSFYILELLDNGAPKKVFVPTDANHKIRERVTGSRRAEVIKGLADTSHVNEIGHQTWNRRYRQYMEDIHTGEIDKMAQVYKSLKAMAQEKGGLSFGERKLLEQAQERLEAELDISL